MAELNAKDIIKRQEQLASKRGNWEQLWRDVARYVLPRQDHFRTQRTGGEQRSENIFDMTAVLANERFAAAMENLLTPRTQRWHELAADDEAVDERQDVKEYLAFVTDLMFRVRYSAQANFASQTHETYMGLGAFGTGAVFIDDATLRIRYKHIHLNQLFFAENWDGIVDTVYRRYPASARNIVQRFKNVPDKVAKCATQDPDKEFTLIHCVQPNADFNPDGGAQNTMPFDSAYVLADEFAVVESGGYFTFPYAVSRYVVAPDEVYGRSPAITSLPEIKMLNEMRKTIIKQAQRAVDPVLLASEDGALTGFSLQSGRINYGGLDHQGRRLVDSLETGNFVVGQEMLNDARRGINEAFLVSLFQFLVTDPSQRPPQMTATEAMLRRNEQGAMLAPAMGRQQSEFLGALVERELDILARAGALPEMPEALQAIGGQVHINYTSPLARAQRGEDGAAILRTLEFAQAIAAGDPAVLDHIDASKTLLKLADINGVPPDILRDDEEVAEIRQQRQQTQAAMAAAQAAPGLAGALKDVTQAAATR